MKKHPTEIDGYDLEDLATKVGKLRYDKLAEFFSYLVKELEKQQKKDEQAGKYRLVDDSDMLINSVSDADFHAAELFQIYKKYMKDELE